VVVASSHCRGKLADELVRGKIDLGPNRQSNRAACYQRIEMVHQRGRGIGRSCCGSAETQYQRLSLARFASKSIVSRGRYECLLPSNVYVNQSKINTVYPYIYGSQSQLTG